MRRPAGVSSLILHLHRPSHRLFASARRRILALAGLALALALAPPARAAMMHHHDLASLALMSDAIVLVQRGAERKIDAWRTATEHRVLKTYAGSLQPGDVVGIEYGAYALAPLWGWEDGGAPRISDEVILFLERATDQGAAAPDGGAPPSWQLAASGLRIFVDGKAHRFEQAMNPGPYEPVPQRRILLQAATRSPRRQALRDRAIDHRSGAPPPRRAEAPG